ncbi:MAG: hypothetical protein AB1671_19625 [Thermodesulfobacteriota bacterium]|jgi:hypothetical protein
MKGYRKKTTRTRRVNEDGLRAYLLTGHDFFDELTHEIMSDEALLKAYWQRWRDELLAERILTHPATRPAGWWWYEQHMPRPGYEEQRAYLEAHGLLTGAEKATLAAWARQRGEQR